MVDTPECRLEPFVDEIGPPRILGYENDGFTKEVQRVVFDIDLDGESLATLVAKLPKCSGKRCATAANGITDVILMCLKELGDLCSVHPGQRHKSLSRSILRIDGRKIRVNGERGLDAGKQFGRKA